jgi:predicted GTPase
VQRFATYEDLAAHEVTIEEREEYEPHLAAGRVVYAGVDYEAILRQAEAEADIVIWDGGNNDLPFYAPDLHLVVVDPHRAGHSMLYHPGEANVRMADAIIINKVDTATSDAVALTWDTVSRLNPRARIIRAASPITLDDGPAIRGRRVLVIEDGPTLTHGGMRFGAGWVAAEQHGAGEIVDPRPYAVGSIADTFAQYPNTGAVLPAMGYSPSQVRELADTIARVPADLVIIGTPIDLRQLISMDKPAVRVRYELAEEGPDLVEMLVGLVRGDRRRSAARSDSATAGCG